MAEHTAAVNVNLLLISQNERLAETLTTLCDAASHGLKWTIQLHHAPTVGAARRLAGEQMPTLLLLGTDMAGAVAATQLSLPNVPLVLITDNEAVARLQDSAGIIDLVAPAAIDVDWLIRLARYGRYLARARPLPERRPIATTPNGNSAGIMQKLLTAALQLTNAQLGTILFIHGTQVIVGQHVPPPEELDSDLRVLLRQAALPIHGTPNLQKIANTGEPLLIDDTSTYPGWLRDEIGSTVGSWLGIPIQVRQELYGILALDHHAAGHFRESHIPPLQALAAESSTALENAALHARLSHQQGELEILNRLSAIAAAARTEDELFADATELLGQTIYTDDFGFLLVERELQRVRTHATYHTSDHVRRLLVFDINEGIVGRTIRSGRPQRVGDVRQDPDFVSYGRGRLAELCVPLQVDDEIIGVLNAESTHLYAFSWSDEQLLVTIANHLSSALTGLRLRAAERRRLQEVESLRQAAMSLTRSLDLSTVLDNILEQLARVIPYDSAALYLRRRESLVHVAGRDAAPQAGLRAPAPVALFEQIAASQTPLVLADAQSERRFPRLTRDGTVHGWLGVPLVASSRVIGFLSIASRRVAAYGENDAYLAQGLANHAALAIENARFYEAEQEARQRADALRRTAQRLHHSLDSRGLADTLLEALEALVPYDSAGVMLIDGQGKLALLRGRGFERWTTADVEAIRFELHGDNLISRIVSGKKSIIIDDTRHHPGWVKREETAYVRNWIGVPLLMQGVCIGCLSVDRAQPHFFHEEHLRAVEILAGQAAAALQNAELFAAVRRNANELHLATETLRTLNASPDAAETLPATFALLQSMSGCAWIVLETLEATGQDPVSARFVRGPSGETALPAGGLPNPSLAVAELESQSEVIFEPDFGAGGASGVGSAMHLPLRAGGIAGQLSMYWSATRAYENLQLQLLQQVASALALALERSRLFAQVDRRARDLAQLNRLARQLTGSLNSAALATMAAEALHDGFGVAAVHVLLETEGAQLRELARAGHSPLPADGDSSSRLGALSGWDAAARRWTSGARRQSLLPAGWRSAVFPLEIAGATRGVVLVLQPERELLRPGILSTIADQLAVALEKAHLFEQSRQRTSELEIVATISAALRTTQTVDEVVPLILSHALQLVDGCRGTLYLLDPEAGRLVLRATQPARPELLARSIPATLGIAGHVLQTGELYVAHDLHSDPLLVTSVVGSEFVADVQTAVSLPLRQQAQIIGVVNLGLPRRRRLTAYETNLLTTLADMAGSALERARFLETLERRVAERTRELAVANERLQELDRLKTKFVADVTHELRTPITSLGLYLDLIRRSPAEKQARYLAIIEQQVSRLGNLIEDIMSLNRLELSKQTPRRVPLDLNGFVAGALQPFQPQLDAADMRLETLLHPALPPVLAEPNQLAQVLTNLLSNAIKYAPGSDVRLETRPEPAGSGVQLLVSDQGPGIQPHEQERLFGRFYRGENSGQLNVPGTGLGLAIVKEIVELHSGRIELESRPGQGATFIVTLPAAGD